MNNQTSNIGFIGAGNMATAIISGLIQKNFLNSEIFVSSPEKEHLDRLKNDFSINVTEDNKEVVNSTATLILAVKPNVIQIVLEELKSVISDKKQLIISIVAGCKMSSIESQLEDQIRIVRVMPNTPASIGLGVSALTANNLATEKDKELSESIFSSIGTTCWLDEGAFDLFTALIGSGPAYVFYLVEALQEAAKDLGLPEEDTKGLITEMIKGSSVLAKKSQDSPSLLRKKVTSPGGVTEKALEVLNSKQVNESFIDAILQATKRSKALGGVKN